MFSQKWYSLLVLFFGISVFAEKMMDEMNGETNGLCMTKEECLDPKSTCLCYCSRICNPRERKADDKPVWDSKKNMCFCKRWDQKNYYKRGCHKKNPAPAQRQMAAPQEPESNEMYE